VRPALEFATEAISGGGDAMSATGLEVFDTTLQKTNLWLNDLMRALAWEDKHKAYLALRGTLHALRDQLRVDEVAQLGAQLPMLIRGLYYEGWDPDRNEKAARRLSREDQQEDFLAQIERPFRRDDDVDPREVARAVFTVLANRVTQGEIEDVRHVLPHQIRDLWP
jgi:uncharacterized protein (DUF2267 family)